MVVYDEDWFWRDLDSDALGIRFLWSEYLPYFLEDQQLAYEWQQDLERQVTSAVADNLLPYERNISYSVEIEQVGSAAQEFHEILLWLQDLPKELITGLVVIGAERSVAKFIAHIRQYANQIRRTHNGKELSIKLDVHSNTLIELCKEHMFHEYEGIADSLILWILKSRQWLTENAPDVDVYEDGTFLIVLSAEDVEYSYLVSRHGNVLEHKVNGVTQVLPKLIPEIEDTSDNAPARVLASNTEWPSQDGVNRSGHIAILAGGNYGLDVHDEFTKPLLQDAVREAVTEILPNLNSESLIAEDHEIGPASGAVEDWVVTLFENRESFAQAIGALVDTWALYEIVSRVRRKLLGKAAAKHNEGQQVRFFLPAGTLAMLCEEYVRRNFHPRAHLTTEWYSLTREFWFGYVSPGHPNAIIEYLVLVSTSKETYRFKVLGTGEVTAHSLRHGRLEADLPVPNLFEDGEKENDGEYA